MGWESNHFHTFIRPGLADQTVVPADVLRVIPSQVNSLFIVDNSIMFWLMQLFPVCRTKKSDRRRRRASGDVISQGALRLTLHSRVSSPYQRCLYSVHFNLVFH